MDKYMKKKIQLIRNCKDDEELKKILNKIYEDGFQDGFNDNNN